jgi:hypothetical protein
VLVAHDALLLPESRLLSTGTGGEIDQRRANLLKPGF